MATTVNDSAHHHCSIGVLQSALGVLRTLFLLITMILRDKYDYFHFRNAFLCIMKYEYHLSNGYLSTA